LRRVGESYASLVGLHYSRFSDARTNQLRYLPTKTTGKIELSTSESAKSG
jgi:hypothetical protein